MVLKEDFVLNNGVKIPKLGFGTWQIPDEVAEESVYFALKNGYRHIDTATAYRNEEGVGRGIKKSGLKREEIFITTKVPAWMKEPSEVEKTLDESLQKLGVDYIDLLLIHAPKPWPEIVAGTEKTYFDENIAVWKVMEKAYNEGKIRAIGVSNFTVEDMENLKKNCAVPITVNQIIMHIGKELHSTIEYCNKNGILVEGYSPIATGKLLGNEVVKRIADKLGVSVPRLCIRYVLQRGALPLPKSTHEEYIIENSKIDFTIPPEDMETLVKLCK